MNRVAVVTDSNTCLPGDILQRCQITVIPFLVIFGDQVFRDGIDMTTRDFYRRLPQADPLPTTSSPGPADLQKIFDQLAGEGTQGAVVVTVSRKLSMLHDVALSVAREMRDFPVRLVDSRMATMAEGFIAMAAARAAEKGLGLGEVAQAALESRPRCGFAFVLDTLSYLQKGGRVPAIATMVGSALNLHPIIGNRRDGTVGILAPAHGKKGAIERSVRAIENRIRRRKLSRIAVMHGSAEAEAEELREKVAARFDFDELYVTEISPVMGAHTGPGTVGLAYEVAPEV